MGWVYVKSYCSRFLEGRYVAFCRYVLGSGELV